MGPIFAQINQGDSTETMFTGDPTLPNFSGLFEGVGLTTQPTGATYTYIAPGERTGTGERVLTPLSQGSHMVPVIWVLTFGLLIFI